MAQTTAPSRNLGSDLPLTDPAQDEFEYAPFASQLAQAVMGNINPQGLVLAVHGKWGSGKSSLLNFIKHDLKALPEDKRPVLVDFNPWWFEGREQIATQLLEQFSAQLPDRLKHVRTLAKLVGNYSKQIASAAADYSGHSWIKTPLTWLLGRFPGFKFLAEKTGVPQVKKKVSAALKASGKRFVFFVDDIDRLTPDEARDFFRAIKALADFPEVVYLLFFDREQVAEALSASLKMDGEAYLEKIIQAPFHLPAVDRSRLQQKLFKELDAIIESGPMPFAFDDGRWGEVFHGGLNRCVEKPRDVVRIINAISVVYPPLAGEVNPVDIIALEFLRVFEPTAYASIRDGKEFFCGRLTQIDYRKAAEKAYFEKWRESLPEGSREWLVSLIGRLFPKVTQALGSRSWASGNEGDWRKELRPCSSECFDVYFRFGVPAGHISRAELDRLLSQDTPEEMAALLLEAREHVFPDGHSKARELIERLYDFDDLEAGQAAKLVTALMSHSHLLIRGEDERGSLTPFRWRIFGLKTKLMERIEPHARQQLLESLATSSPGLSGLVEIADMVLESKSDPSKAPKGLLDLEDAFPENLAAIVGKRLNQASLEDLLSMSALDDIVDRWKAWGDPARIREVFEPVLEDDRLLTLLDRFVRTGTRRSGNRVRETYHLPMETLAVVMDLDAMESRILSLQSRGDLTVRQRAATNRYLKGLQLIREGKDPDGFYFEDFDD
ncbi:KAP family P-loop NTPase fold protein [Caballeronia sordidicola]|uniref:KAP family P-loop NTPase fold protein n=1 Tax=Caballeronia sordidicola TaxID=196367 RepID=UPI0004D0060A|nr:P-loop NTPase fold protein [Caballeronia sordidicola]